MTLIRGISGIRGIVNDGLNADVISKHMIAFSKIQPKGPILVARDSRSHGSQLIDIACTALALSGRDVINCDIIPTPSAQFLIEKNDYSGGIVITASHNPTEWNGIKFIDHDGCFLNQNHNLKLFKIADEYSSLNKTSKGLISVHKDPIKAHINHTINLSAINKTNIKKMNFKVVVDAVNGAASKALPLMLKELGCEVIKINCEPNGIFPRGAEPLPEHLNQLSNTVKEFNADVGFATDPDGDRLAIVDELGKPIGEEYTLTICADGVLSDTNNKNPIVTNLSTTMALDVISKKYNNEVKRSSVGEINVVNLMKKYNSIIGGEGNGGVILPESHYGRDSLVGAALFLNRMSKGIQSVSQIHSSMPIYFIVKDKINLGDLNPNKVLAKISEEYKTYNQNKMDGLKIIFQNKWLHIRKSNTEPIVRIYGEAKSLQSAKSLVEEIKSLIKIIE